MEPHPSDHRTDSHRSPESDFSQSTPFNVPALLDSFKSTVGKRDQMPASFPSAETILPKQSKIADTVINKLSDGTNPGADVAAALKKMDNLSAASFSRLPNGRHQVQMHFDHSTQMPPINANIHGFRPGPTNVGQDVSFTLSHSQNGIRLDNMHGFSGSVTGPLGRTRPSWSNGLHIGRDQNGTPFVDVDSTVQGPFRMRASHNRFGESNFPPGSPMRELMHNPDVLGDAAGALRLFQSRDQLQQASLKKNANGGFDVTAESKTERDVAIDQKLPAAGVTIKSIHLDKTVSGTLSHDATSAKFGNLHGINVKANGLLGDMNVTPKSVELKNNTEGVPVVRLELELKGTTIPLEIPVSKLRSGP